MHFIVSPFRSGVPVRTTVVAREHRILGPYVRCWNTNELALAKETVLFYGFLRFTRLPREGIRDFRFCVRRGFPWNTATGRNALRAVVRGAGQLLPAPFPDRTGMSFRMCDSGS
ncbi:hypothetical protein, partial [Streptomyces lushanensis]|uniref:hypothetical protein n=1 Tax=Streptomyces lushanensis TaxID=1434255 RepID=UPI001B80D869